MSPEIAKTGKITAENKSFTMKAKERTELHQLKKLRTLHKE